MTDRAEAQADTVEKQDAEIKRLKAQIVNLNTQLEVERYSAEVTHLAQASKGRRE